MTEISTGVRPETQEQLERVEVAKEHLNAGRVSSAQLELGDLLDRDNPPHIQVIMTLAEVARKGHGADSLRGFMNTPEAEKAYGEDICNVVKNATALEAEEGRGPGPVRSRIVEQGEIYNLAPINKTAANVTFGSAEERRDRAVSPEADIRAAEATPELVGEAFAPAPAVTAVTSATSEEPVLARSLTEVVSSIDLDTPGSFESKLEELRTAASNDPNWGKIVAEANSAEDMRALVEMLQEEAA